MKEMLLLSAYLAVGAWCMGNLVKRSPGRFNLRDNVTLLVLVGFTFIWPVCLVLSGIAWMICRAAGKREP